LSGESLRNGKRFTDNLLRPPDCVKACQKSKARRRLSGWVGRRPLLARCSEKTLRYLRLNIRKPPKGGTRHVPFLACINSTTFPAA
jgi:hypothetical protein